MDEQLFKMQFITTFLASWCAANYDVCCFTGNFERLNNPPVEDAEDLANKAWNKYMNTYNHRVPK